MEEIHGRNRLMGNSLLDVIVFGRGTEKLQQPSKDVTLGKMNLDHVEKYAETAKRGRHRHQYGISASAGLCR